MPRSTPMVFPARRNRVGPGDGLELHDCRITNAVKCLPPDNRPVAAEINTCNRFLAARSRAARVLVTLGGVAHKAAVRALGLRQADHPFGHAAEYALASGHRLIASYHCSRYNRNTRRLTPAMFDEVFGRATSSGRCGARLVIKRFGRIIEP